MLFSGGAGQSQSNGMLPMLYNNSQQPQDVQYHQKKASRAPTHSNSIQSQLPSLKSSKAPSRRRKTKKIPSGQGYQVSVKEPSPPNKDSRYPTPVMLETIQEHPGSGTITGTRPSQETVNTKSRSNKVPTGD
jgi:hypothetical protein